ncbi:MAG: S8 family serine peptidase [Firmicutes bacterium]|nr:S8 family serine peptidase [Bacillota bacterium]
MKKALVLVLSLMFILGGAAMLAVGLKPVSYAYTDLYVKEMIRHEHAQDELLIGFKDVSEFKGQEKQYREELEKVKDLSTVHIDETTFCVSVCDLNKNPVSVINGFKNNLFIDYVEPNYVGQLELIPNEESYKASSNTFSLINAQEGWDIITGGGPPVAVIDSGCADHTDMQEYLPGYSPAGLNPNQDKKGHGTGVAGTIGAIGNNGKGAIGMNWDASIMPVKIDSENGTILVANIALGIIWAADNGAKILNLSLGYPTESVTLKNAINYAVDKGCLIFAASGNESVKKVCYPAQHPDVVAVGSTGFGTIRFATSNYGPGINMMAASSYYTIRPGGYYDTLSGTSFATPQAAGLASLVWALLPDYTAAQIRDLMQDSCKKLPGPNDAPYVYDQNGWNEEVGYGLIDCGLTLARADAIANNQTVTGVSVSPGATSVMQQQTKQFTATVLGNNNPWQRVTWSVEGNNDQGTVINQLGELTIGHNELGTLTVRVRSSLDPTKSGTATVTAVFNTLPKAETPEAYLEYGLEALYGLVGGETYRINGGLKEIARYGYIVCISYIGQTVSIVRCGDGVTTKDSDPQIIYVPARPAPPDVITVGCTTPLNNDGKITGVNDLMEWRREHGNMPWTQCTDTDITGLTPGGYELRVACVRTGSNQNFRSDTILVKIKSYEYALETIPEGSIEINYDNRRLTGFERNGSYKIIANLISADYEGDFIAINVEPEWIGTAIYIIKLGDGITTGDSLQYSLYIPDHPSAPIVQGYDCTNFDQNDGRITKPLGIGIEYRQILPIESFDWISTNTTLDYIGNLGPGTYEVRFRATSTSFESHPATIIINECLTERMATPNAGIDYINETLTGLDINGVYKFNGSQKTITGTTYTIEETWFGTTVSIVRVGGDDYEDSLAQELSIPNRQAVPSGLTVTSCTTPLNNNGTISGDAYMEYKSGTSAWTALSLNGMTYSVSGLTAGTYFVRRKATTGPGAFAGHYVTVEIYIYSGKLQQAAPTITVSSKTPMSITLVSISGGEFRLDSGAWQDSNEFEGLTSGLTYQVQARMKETPTHDPSPIASLSVMVDINKMPVPVITSISYKNEIIYFSVSATYIINGTYTFTGASCPIRDEWFGKTITIVTVGNVTAEDSGEITKAIRSRSSETVVENVVITGPGLMDLTTLILIVAGTVVAFIGISCLFLILAKVRRKRS